MILGDTQIHEELDRYDHTLAPEVALLFSQKDPSDIYDAVVSSQFDADRLDYLQRDRYMSGTRDGGFDFSWLLDCLEIGRINIGQAEDYVEVYGLYLNHKGLSAAEAYVLARYHLYSQVYLHKTTRSAERMLAALLKMVARLCRDGRTDDSGLTKNNLLVKFLYATKPDLDSYLALDDTVVWSSINEMRGATASFVSGMATRILNRSLFKCLDVGALSRNYGSDSVPHFKRRLQEYEKLEHVEFLRDDLWLTAYGYHQYEDSGAFQKVLIGRPDHSGKSDDLKERSKIVASIERQRIFRIYAQDHAQLAKAEKLWHEVVQ